MFLSLVLEIMGFQGWGIPVGLESPGPGSMGLPVRVVLLSVKDGVLDGRPWCT